MGYSEMPLIMFVRYNNILYLGYMIFFFFFKSVKQNNYQYTKIRL